MMAFTSVSLLFLPATALSGFMGMNCKVPFFDGWEKAEDQFDKETTWENYRPYGMFTWIVSLALLGAILMKIHLFNCYREIEHDPEHEFCCGKKIVPS